MSKKYKEKNKSNKNFIVKNPKKIKNVYFRFFYIMFIYLVKFLINIFRFLLISIKKIITGDKSYSRKNIYKYFPKLRIFKHEEYPHKFFSYRCSLILSIIIILSTLFVYIESDIIYIYPIFTSVIPIMILNKGATSSNYSEVKELLLCNKVLNINIFLFLLFFIINPNKNILFIKFSMILIFLVPLIIGNLNKED